MRSLVIIRVLLVAAFALVLSTATFAQIGISITIGPPALPVYEQPPCPSEGYLWDPGYWAYDYDDGDYYWVPGTWVTAPEPGLLWTPGYWGWNGGAFIWNEGYWGPHVGFYGGVVYGFGYFGEGFEGGRWQGNQFYYNRSVTNINVTNVRNVYNTTVVNNTTVNRVSYNGGNGGTTARPTSQDEVAARERHVPPVAVQTQHAQAARSNPELRASANHGKPPIAATAKPGEFHSGVVAAKQAGAPYQPPANRNAAKGARPGTTSERPENNTPKPATAVHPNELQPHEPLPAPNTGNAKRDQKYQQQQQKLSAKQQQQHQKLQQQQDKEHQRAQQQKASEQKQQQMEQRHQQQTQQMEQRHNQQLQQMQRKQQPAAQPAKPPAKKP